MREADILREIQQFPCVRRECVLDTMKKYAPLFDDMKPPYGVPLTICRQRVHVKYTGQMKERNKVVRAGDVLELRMPAVIRENKYIELAPRFAVRFGTMNGSVSVPTILHEMIHMYQICMRHCYIGLRRVPEFIAGRSEERVNADIENKYPEVRENLGIAYAIASMSTKESLRRHDMLFISKSMQLDCELGYPVGTVFGYGLAEYIQQSKAVVC